MPQASSEIQKQWPGADKEAIAYLQGRGWRLTPRWFWTKPKPDHEPTDRENSAVQYLIDEWDFGGISPVA